MILLILVNLVILVNMVNLVNLLILAILVNLVNLVSLVNLVAMVFFFGELVYSSKFVDLGESVNPCDCGESVDIILVNLTIL